MTDSAKPGKILVLMSGGVDSSTAAALLVRAGYKVSGVYLKLWESMRGGRASDPTEARPPDVGDPCWAQEMRDAARVAAHLKIPFQVWDVTPEYKKRVLQNFYSEYAAGRTPNPDVLCNSEIKFGVALERALAAGFDYVATGHYARIVRQRAKSKEQRAIEPYALCSMLYAGIDTDKDQSYFLWRLTQEQLSHVMFPIGECSKPQVRALARQFGLHNWNKKDSQGVCFLGKIRLKEFLGSVDSRLRGNDRRQEPGPIADVHGQLLGFHDGLAHFTIGQRHGTRLGGGGPYYVVEKDMAGNTLIVANEQDEPKYRTVECTVGNKVNWIGAAAKSGAQLMVRTRYRASLAVGVIEMEPEKKFHSSKYGTFYRVVFDEPQRAVAPGQSIVFYDGERVVGGGIIEKTILTNPLALCKPQKFARVS